MPRDENNYATLKLFTTTTMGATGATSLVAAPATGLAVAIFDIQAANQTNTTGFIELGFSPTDAAAQFRKYNNSLGSDIIQINMIDPWILDTQTSFRAVLSVTAASTPSLRITVGYRILIRNR